MSNHQQHLKLYEAKVKTKCGCLQLYCTCAFTELINQSSNRLCSVTFKLMCMVENCIKPFLTIMCYAERKCFRAAQGSQGIQCCRAYYKAHQRETYESLELKCNSSIIEQLLMTSCSVVFPCYHSCVLQYLYCMHSASCSVMPARPNFGIACNFYFLLTEVGYRRVA